MKEIERKNMKKIMLLLLLLIIFTSSVSATDYGSWKLKDENMASNAQIEYRYRFYKNNKVGEYLFYDDLKVNDYEYKDDNTLEYLSYSNWLEECDVDENKYQVEIKEVNAYQKVLPTRFIMLSAIDEDINILDIKVYDKDNLVNYKIINCANCVTSINQNLSDKILKLQLDSAVDSENLAISINLEDDGSYRLITSNDANFNNISLFKEVSGSNMYTFDKSWLSLATYSDIYYLDSDITNDFIKKIDTTTMCRYRKFKNYYYNLEKVYYDDNYYVDVLGYIKDSNDYKIYYRNPIVSAKLSTDVIKSNNKVSFVDNKNVDNKKEDSVKINTKLDNKKPTSELVNTLEVSDNKNVIKYIILIVIGLIIIYLIYINSSKRKELE